MIRSRFIRSFALGLAAVVALSCADTTPTGPIAPATAQDGLISGVLGGVNGLLGSVLKVVVGVVAPVDVHPVKWAATHDNQEHRVMGTIDYNGGTLSIPESDFTITFPYGALSSPTPITIVSDESGYVSYDMLPHGITFARPVIVTQRLRNTEIYGTPEVWNSFGAYFADQDPLASLNILTGVLQAAEKLTTTILASPSGTEPAIQVWQLKHFSRYMLASG
ncbi:MAG TPA: hypothetical protein VD771_07850 [Gemmatimonadaceae bacterium]|nr:hypothetical protein [Gemmatimonadaceae bacterium]